MNSLLVVFLVYVALSLGYVAGYAMGYRSPEPRPGTPYRPPDRSVWEKELY